MVNEWGGAFRRHYEQIGGWCADNLVGLTMLALTVTVPRSHKPSPSNRHCEPSPYLNPNTHPGGAHNARTHRHSTAVDPPEHMREVVHARAARGRPLHLLPIHLP